MLRNEGTDIVNIILKLSTLLWPTGIWAGSGSDQLVTSDEISLDTTNKRACVYLSVCVCVRPSCVDIRMIWINPLNTELNPICQ